MTVVQACPSGNFRLRKLAFLASALLIFVSSGAARDHKAIRANNKPHVLAHIQFDGMSEVDMTIQARSDDRYFLYVQHAKGEGASIIDISKPEKPRVVAALPAAYPSRDSRIAITGNLAIVSDNLVGLPQSSESSNDDLVLWDTTDPASPRLVHRFSKVVKWTQDDRDFVYVLADDGLWIVSPSEQASNMPLASNYGVD